MSPVVSRRPALPLLVRGDTWHICTTPSSQLYGTSGCVTAWPHPKNGRLFRLCANIALV